MRISAEEWEQNLPAEWKDVMRPPAQAFHQAREGAILPDSEEIVRQARAEFRQQVYERAGHLAANPAAPAAFSPGTQHRTRPAG